jgi:hypothetical protein
MSEVANQFSTIFRDEHRAVRDALFELSDTFRRREPAESRGILARIATLTGPHFRYEEEVMYPSLVEIFGQEYVSKLYGDHNRLIDSAERLVQLTGKNDWTDEEVEEGLELVRGMLPHVSDCDGLSIMVERFSETTVKSILDARERCNQEGIDLLRWARELRKRPVTAEA